MLPLNAWLVARLGAKRLYLICFCSFTLASFLWGVATTMPELIGARLIQGMAGGLLAPLTQLMVARVAGRQFARVLGYAVVPVLLAPLGGPDLAGTILKYLGWPWHFYVNLPVGILAVVLAAWILPHDKPATQERPFDLTGFLMISPAFTTVVAITVSLSANVSCASAHAFLIPRIHQEADSSKAPIRAPGQLAVRPESA
jgi:MFS family permease